MLGKGPGNDYSLQLTIQKSSRLKPSRKYLSCNLKLENPSPQDSVTGSKSSITDTLKKTPSVTIKCILFQMQPPADEVLKVPVVRN